MVTATRTAMAKKKPEAAPGGEPAKMTTTKVEVNLLRKARMVAIHRGIDLHEYVDSLFRGPVERDYDAMIREEGGR